jgi:tetratricopeptide (TPR) repeat protein
MSGIFTAIGPPFAQDPNRLLLFIGGGSLLLFLGGLCARWALRARGARPLKQEGGFSPQKGGPVAAHYERGNAFFKSGDMVRAIEFYSKALRLNPNYADALVGRGVALFKKGDDENAIADLNEALYLTKSARAYYYRGHIHVRQGNYVRAIADYDQSLRLNPGQDRVRAARELAMKKATKTGQ